MSYLITHLLECWTEASGQLQAAANAMSSDLSLSVQMLRSSDLLPDPPSPHEADVKAGNVQAMCIEVIKRHRGIVDCLSLSLSEAEERHALLVRDANSLLVLRHEASSQIEV